MKIGLISDIHSNYNAMTAVLDYLYRMDADIIYNCGDIIGYGPMPNECIESIANSAGYIESVAGNHEAAVLADSGCYGFNPAAKSAVMWTCQHLTVENMDYLKNLPEEGESEYFQYMHGSPRDPINEYIISCSQAEVNFGMFRGPLCIVGHTHIPCYFEMDEKGNISKSELFDEAVIKLKQNKRYIVNPGSVGQPRDRDPRSSFCVYDIDSGSIKLHRVEYDIAGTQKMIREAGLPEFLSERLSLGM